MGCDAIEVDGVPVRINLAPGKTVDDLTEQDVAALRELVRVCQSKLADGADCVCGHRAADHEAQFARNPCLQDHCACPDMERP